MDEIHNIFFIYIIQWYGFNPLRKAVGPDEDFWSNYIKI